MSTTGYPLQAEGHPQCCAPQNREHGIRSAPRLIQAGVDVYTVQKVGRWKTISMVLRYAHHQPESLRAGAEVLDRLRREHSTILAQRGAAPSASAA